MATKILCIYITWTSLLQLQYGIWPDRFLCQDINGSVQKIMYSGKKTNPVSFTRPFRLPRKLDLILTNFCSNKQIFSLSVRTILKSSNGFHVCSVMLRRVLRDTCLWQPLCGWESVTSNIQPLGGVIPFILAIKLKVYTELADCWCQKERAEVRLGALSDSDKEEGE